MLTHRAALGLATLLLASPLHAEESPEQALRKARKKAEDALIKAAKGGDVSRVRALLQDGTDVNTRDGSQRTALLHAARGGHLPLLRALVEARPDLDAWDEKGRTPLMEAAGRDEALPASVLVAAGADVNLVDEDGWTALMHAARGGTLAAARSIIRAPKQSSLDAVAKDGRSALGLAAERGRTALVEALIVANAGTHKPEIGGQALQIAAEKRHANVVMLLMEARAPLGFATWQDELPLHAAAARGQRLVVEALVEAGTEPDLADRAGQTALVKAAAGGHDEVVASLLQLGASPDLPDREGRTALMHAAAHASSGSVGSIRALVRAGAQLDRRTAPDGMTALMISAQKGNALATDELLRAGAQAALQSAGRSALDFALAEGNKRCAESLGYKETRPR